MNNTIGQQNTPFPPTPCIPAPLVLAPMSVLMVFVFQDGWSPLWTACFNGHLDVAMTLIEAGANVNQADKVSSV